MNNDHSICLVNRLVEVTTLCSFRYLNFVCAKIPLFPFRTYPVWCDRAERISECIWFGAEHEMLSAVHLDQISEFRTPFKYLALKLSLRPEEDCIPVFYKIWSAPNPVIVSSRTEKWVEEHADATSMAQETTTRTEVIYWEDSLHYICDRTSTKRLHKPTDKSLS